jgi:ribonuclease P protein component
LEPEEQEGRENEKDISAVKREESQGSRFPKENVDQSGKEDPQKASGQEKGPADRAGQQMILEMGTCCSMLEEGFSKSVRVKKPIQFRRIMVKGAKSRGRNLVLYRLEGTEEQRFGIRIGRGTKSAVVRNKLKRTIREFLRKNKDSFARDESVVVVCRAPAEAVNPEQLKEELAGLIRSGKPS